MSEEIIPVVCHHDHRLGGKAEKTRRLNGCGVKKKRLNKGRRVTKKYVWRLESLEILVLMNVYC